MRASAPYLLLLRSYLQQGDISWAGLRMFCDLSACYTVGSLEDAYLA